MSTTTTTKRRPKARRKPSQRQLDDHQARVDTANADLMDRLERMANDPTEWQHFIETVAAWGARYSLGNQCLLLDEWEERHGDENGELDAEPQMFLPYGDKDAGSGWLKEGRVVSKGQRAFLVWAPIKRRLSEDEAAKWQARTGKTIKRDGNGRLPITVVGWRFARTFELGQTEAMTEAGEAYVVPTVQVRRSVKAYGGQTATPLTGDDPTGVFDDVVKLIEGKGYTYEIVAQGKGYLSGKHRKANGITVTGPRVRKVQVREDLSPAQRIKTTIHEYAHIMCEHVDPLARLGEDLHRGRRETEAESVAHIVCKAFGLDSSPYTDAYVMGWAEGDMDLVREAAATVLRVARDIVEELAPMAPFKAQAEPKSEEDAA